MARENKQALYLLGERLIKNRTAVVIVTTLVTAWFGWHTAQLEMITSFGELLPNGHPFIEVHDEYAKDFGGANNITVMVEVEDGHLFNVETLGQIYILTEELDRIYGVNHNQVDSIGHRTTRHLAVAAGGTLRSEPVMIGLPNTEDEAASVRRVVHESENIYGILVSLDDKAALIRANFIEGRLDYSRIFEDMNQRVIEPMSEGWIGAYIVGVDPDRAEAYGLEKGKGAQIKKLFPDSVAAAAGLEKNDIITHVNGVEVVNRWEIGNAVAAGEGSAELTYQRGDETGTVSVAGGGSDILLWAAGEPRLYGWVYHFSGQVFQIFIIVTVFIWLLLYIYFKDWRGALRPTVTGLISAIWGLGFIDLIGFALDPLILVIPFFITARAVSHSVQMHDRYYEEYWRAGQRGLEGQPRKHEAIVASFAEMFVPTLSGIITDALGLLVIILVPILMLQKLAATASFWIMAITVSELLLNPIIYDLLQPPEEDVIEKRREGVFLRGIMWFADVVLSPRGRVITIVFWICVSAACMTQWSKLIIGDPTAASPLLHIDSEYNASHTKIQGKFGGVEPLIVVAEGYDKNAMKYPNTLRTMEKFQRHLERDPSIGYSFSLADIIRAVNSVFHELEPKWGVIPNNWIDVGGLFFIFFSGSPPTETAKYVSTDYRTAHVTFFCRDHKGENVERIIHRCQEFIDANPLDKGVFRLAGGLIGVLAAANEELLRNDVLMNALGFGTIFLVLLFTYRSVVAGLLMLMPLLISNFTINAYMGWNNMGININTLPVVTVGVGFGIDYGLYIVSRTIEIYFELEDEYSTSHKDEAVNDARVAAAVHGAVCTAGKAVTFVSTTLIFSTLFWLISDIRFNSEMGLLLAIWMTISWGASLTLLPVLLAVIKPKFIQRRPAIDA
ncbi:MAG: putative RND superfamily exporter protein [Hyphomicrobiaceae bacterium]|jgi:predicted RND superfamily exporter protein